MKPTTATAPDPAGERLASEVADVRASISLVRSGVATSITLTGLRFGRQLADRLGAVAARQGVHLEASFWPEEDGGDLRVTLARSPDIASPTAGGPDVGGETAATNG
ncbi:MAG: hypothetical protein ABSA21_06060 [Candidatus Limnocylindrales bacterium]|jgi:hypothetical protein